MYKRQGHFLCKYMHSSQVLIAQIENIVYFLFGHHQCVSLYPVSYTHLDVYKRQGYALAIVVGWLTYNRASSLFVSYLTMLLATVYLSATQAYYVLTFCTTAFSADSFWAEAFFCCSSSS